MEVVFKDTDLEKIETEAAFNGGHSQAVVRAFRKRMQFIRAAADKRDLYAMKSLHFEKLKGERSGQRSIRLNAQWRLILEIHDAKPKNKAVICAIEDYH